MAMRWPSRVEELQELFGRYEIDAMLVSSPVNRRYLSGFTGSTGYLLISQEEAILATDFRYTGRAERQATGFRVVSLDAGHSWFRNAVQDPHLRRIGYEGEHLTTGSHASLTRAIDASGKARKPELVITMDLLEEIRATKDQTEQDRLFRAIEITDEAFEEISAIIKPGMTELEISWRLERAIRERGAEGMAFDTIVASGPNGAIPHHEPEDTVIRDGDLVVIDVGARYQGYCADLTRTVMVGEPDRKLRKIYSIVLEAQLAAEEKIESGMTGAQADELARKVIAAAGYGENFGHALGHGVGLAIHEYPRLSRKSTDVLDDGMVFTIEPGIYMSDWGGVRIEDVVVLEGGRPRVVSSAPKLELAT